MRNFITLLLTALAFSGCNPKAFTSKTAFDKACKGKQKQEPRTFNARAFNAQYPPSK